MRSARRLNLAGGMRVAKAGGEGTSLATPGNCPVQTEESSQPLTRKL